MRQKNRLRYGAVIVACASMVLAFFSAAECFAFEVMKTRGINAHEIKWSQGKVSYLINSSAGPSGSLSAIVAALQTWTDVAGSSFVFDFSGQTTAQTQVNTTNGQNIISFQSLGQSGVLASNYFWYSTADGAMIESDIIVNTSYTWRTDGAAGGYDVQNILTHELGHSLSLDDLYDLRVDSEKTMYGYAASGETKKRTLHQDDIDGISYLYPGAGQSAPAILSYDAYPTDGPAPLTVAFECSAVDYDGSIAQYYFDFGDGSTQTQTSGSAAHTYTGVGSYGASCVAFDNDGATATSEAIAISVTDSQDWTQIPGQLNQIVCGDLDGNGLDGVAGVTSQDMVFYTTDLLSYQYIPGYLRQITTGDLNGDGLADLTGITSEGYIFYSIDLQNWNYLPGILESITAGDLNGDGHDDLIGIIAGRIYYTTDLSTWQVMSGSFLQVACGDLNGDGKDDVVGLTGSGYIFYTLDLMNWSQVPGALSQLATGDLNADGHSDLVGIAGNGQVYYTLDLNTWQTIDGNFKQVASGDLNGDGKDDVVGLTESGEIWMREE